MAETENTVIVLRKEKDTKNTVRFEEVHDETEHPVVRNLYVSKPVHAKMGSPDEIKVTIESN